MESEAVAIIVAFSSGSRVEKSDNDRLRHVALYPHRCIFVGMYTNIGRKRRRRFLSLSKIMTVINVDVPVHTSLSRLSDMGRNWTGLPPAKHCHVTHLVAKVPRPMATLEHLTRRKKAAKLIRPNDASLGGEAKKELQP